MLVQGVWFAGAYQFLLAVSCGRRVSSCAFVWHDAGTGVVSLTMLVFSPTVRTVGERYRVGVSVGLSRDVQCHLGGMALPLMTEVGRLASHCSQPAALLLSSVRRSRVPVSGFEPDQCAFTGVPGTACMSCSERISNTVPTMSGE